MESKATTERLFIRRCDNKRGGWTPSFPTTPRKKPSPENSVCYVCNECQKSEHELKVCFSIRVKVSQWNKSCFNNLALAGTAKFKHGSFHPVTHFLLNYPKAFWHSWLNHSIAENFTTSWDSPFPCFWLGSKDSSALKLLGRLPQYIQ